MKIKIIAVISLIFGLVGCSDDNISKSEPLSPDMQQAKEKTLTLCSGCHGPEGMAVAQLTPNLAGQNADYLIKQLKDYQSGLRDNHPPMNHIARLLSEKDVLLISQWYARQKPKEG